MSRGGPGPEVPRIAVIPGDGIGPEVVDVGMRVLATLGESRMGFEYRVETFPWGCEHFARHGTMMPADALETLRGFDAIYFGAVGWPTVPDHVSLWGLRLAIVQGLDQGVNVRPAAPPPGVAGPLAHRRADELAFVVVRENSEGEYAGAGGRMHRGGEADLAAETSIYTRRAVERVARFAFELGRSRPARRVTSVTKSNASRYTSVLWDEVVAAVAAEYPDVAFDSVLVDAATARIVLEPGSVDVLVASNLHADIISDLTAAVCGSLGLAPSANLNVDGGGPSMFEPVHGSAPDLAGRGVANPIGAVLSAALMLDHLGFENLGDAVREAVADACRDGHLPRDLGGTATTAEMASAITDDLARRLG